MSEKEDDGRHVVRGPVHPAVQMAVQMAERLHEARTSTITAAEFEELFKTTTAAIKDLSDQDIKLRTAALMVATALHLQATLGSVAGPASGASPTDPAMAEASVHAQRTMQTVAAISAFADRFGGGKST